MSRRDVLYFGASPLIASILVAAFPGVSRAEPVALQPHSTAAAAEAPITAVINTAPFSSRLRSATSSTASVLIVRNDIPDVTVLVSWINYDGDAEPYTLLETGDEWTVDTFESHPWRFTANGQILKDVVSGPGEQRVLLTAALLPPSLDKAAAGTAENGGSAADLGDSSDGSTIPGSSTSSSSSSSSAPQVASKSSFLADGFDGLGKEEDQYAKAELTTMMIDASSGGAIAALSVEGYDSPLELYMNVIEASRVMRAGNGISRRPDVYNVWLNSLQALDAVLQRVVITRLVNNTLYSRLLLLLPSGSTVSIDSNPVDALAMALTTEVPVFVAKDLAKLVQKAGSPVPKGPHPRDEVGGLDQLLIPDEDAEDGSSLLEALKQREGLPSV